jgi:hypothetical protein
MLCFMLANENNFKHKVIMLLHVSNKIIKNKVFLARFIINITVVHINSNMFYKILLVPVMLHEDKNWTRQKHLFCFNAAM